MDFFTKQLEETKYGETITKTVLDIPKIVWTSIFAIIAIIILFWSFTIVSPWERGVVVTLGRVTWEVLWEGFHIKKPIIDDVVKMDVQIQKDEWSSSAASRDLQSVTATIAVNYALDPSKVTKIYQDLRKDYVTRIIYPSIQESVKSATSKFTADELITKREEVRTMIEESISIKLEKYGMIVSQVNIVNFEFSKAFDNAIEAKVTAEQEALRAENELKRVQFEAQQEIEKAKAMAEKTRLEVEALKQWSDIIEKIYAEAQLEAAKKWNGQLPTHMYGSAPLPLLNVGQ